MPALHTLPLPHGAVAEHVRAHTCLPPIVVQVAPAPHVVELVHALEHMPEVLPVSFMHVRPSAMHSASDAQGLPMSVLLVDASPGGSPPSCAHGPASPPQGTSPPPVELEHAAVIRTARPKAREAIRVIDIVRVPL